MAAPRATAIPTTAREREAFLAPYLPRTRPSQETFSSTVAAKGARSGSKRSLSLPSTAQKPSLLDRLTHPTDSFAQLFHLLLFALIHTVFTVYIRTRRLYHTVVSRALSALFHHHRTVELIRRDIRDLSRLPKHLSILLELDHCRSFRRGADDESMEKLIADAAEVAAWTAASGIPMLSIYERTGALKASLPALYEELFRVFGAYYPSGNEPEIILRAPHLSAFTPTSNGHQTSKSRPEKPKLEIILLSEADSRTTLVDLTKTLTEMAQDGRLRPQDVTQELIDAEMTAASCGEPDLLLVMAGEGDGDGQSTAGSSELKLRGYPCWQVRLTEIL